MTLICVTMMKKTALLSSTTMLAAHRQSDCSLIHVVFILTALDEGDIALLKTYVSMP